MSNRLAKAVALVFASLSILAAQKSFRSRQDAYPRVRRARLNCAARIDSLFTGLDLPYPPCQIVLSVFKEPGMVELWAADSSRQLDFVKSYPMTAFSGRPGPKRRRGDRQVPEGFYHITHFNPQSSFHLSLGVDYPNASDRILSRGRDPGGSIYIHGSAVTIGCIPLGDAAIEELYTICVDARSSGQNLIPVYIFPCRRDSLAMQGLKVAAASDTSLIAFWQNLYDGYRILMQRRRAPVFRTDALGRYLFSGADTSRASVYAWVDSAPTRNSLAARISPPDGYERKTDPPGSFGDWLRQLPLKSGYPPVHLYDGTEKAGSTSHHAVVDIDVGSEDLQQCADAILRLHAEYYYGQKEYSKISYLLTSGASAPYSKWASGFRPAVTAGSLTWSRRSSISHKYGVFKNYLNFIFKYAGTASLARQTRAVARIENLKAGNIFIQGGFPGHAVLVLDIAEKRGTGEKLFLLGQSFMPAQDVHILKNLQQPALSPWYPADFGDTLFTPDWKFTKHDLRRFR